MASADMTRTVPASTSGRKPFRPQVASHGQSLLRLRHERLLLLRSCRCRATVSEKVQEELEGEALDSWKSCVGRIEALGFEPDKAEQIVGQAFGWGKQAYWLNNKTNEAPDEEQVGAVLEFLERDLKIQGDDLQKVVKKFPEVINCDIETRLKANLQHMQKAYYMKEPAAINTIKRKPEVLGYTYDCEGSCEGMCNQCWVRL